MKLAVESINGSTKLEYMSCSIYSPYCPTSDRAASTLIGADSRACPRFGKLWAHCSPPKRTFHPYTQWEPFNAAKRADPRRTIPQMRERRRWFDRYSSCDLYQHQSTAWACNIRQVDVKTRCQEHTCFTLVVFKKLERLLRGQEDRTRAASGFKLDRKLVVLTSVQKSKLQLVQVPITLFHA